MCGVRDFLEIVFVSVLSGVYSRERFVVRILKGHNI